MIHMLFDGQIALFLLIVIALALSLSFHEFGHAATALYFGDDTAKRMGRLTLNPLAHLDPMGMLMVVMVGFGWAKPVPTDPRNFNSRWADLWISAAGPLMNLLVAFVAVNFYVGGSQAGWEFLRPWETQAFFTYLVTINLTLMIFNLIPLGALDGHYILPYFLTRRTAQAYQEFNAQYGNMVLFGLLLLSAAGLPVFRFVFSLGRSMIGYLSIF